MNWFVLITTPFLFIAVLLSHFQFSGRVDLPLLVGYRDDAILDLWSIHHLLAGVVVGRIVFCKFKEPLVFVSAVLFVALAWEGSEVLMEAGEIGKGLAVWKGGFEHWGNRFVGDLVAVTLGGWWFWTHRSNRLWQSALVFCLLWFAINFTTPDSMYVQRFLLKL
ncbi:MAG: hypothetical protein HQ530_00020 [Parcubacteria group bacterium]|nr:hypothetical protein [Parcubacteria group bacterium]